MINNNTSINKHSSDSTQLDYKVLIIIANVFAKYRAFSSQDEISSFHEVFLLVREMLAYLCLR